MIASPLATWPAVTLPELQAEAAFLTRRDRKYLVPAATLDHILEAVAAPPGVLEIAGLRSFTYTTTYFDDQERAAYFRALRKRPDRFKVRTRLYEESGIRLLEIKLRNARGWTVKERISHTGAALDTLTANERSWLGAFSQVGGRARHLQPCLTTRYRRSTLLLPGGEGRVTIDRDLTVITPDGAGLTIPGLVIVETKSGQPATAIDRLLWRSGIRPQSISKFTIGLALLEPTLPANRWHRVRTRLAAIAVPHRMSL